MRTSPRVIFATVLAIAMILGCARGKIPVVLDYKPSESYEVIGTVETKTEWHGLQWLWYWWHYMPWYPSIQKYHEKHLVKKARKLGADAITNIRFFPARKGARADAIRFKPSP